MVDEVGPDTKATFDRLRGTYVQGLLFYDLYTVVEQLARLLLKLALRERFVAFYEGVVHLSRDGVAQEVRADRFEDVRSAMNPRRGKWRLVLKSGDEAPFDPSLHGLLEWARRERLLRGQRNRTRELAFVAMRNLAAHPEGYSLVGPVDALKTLDWLSETVNHLYGHRTPSGSHYPEPIERSPVLVLQGRRGEVSVANLTVTSEADPAEMGGQVRIVLLAGGARAAEVGRTGELYGARAFLSNTSGGREDGARRAPGPPKQNRSQTSATLWTSNSPCASLSRSSRRCGSPGPRPTLHLIRTPSGSLCVPIIPAPLSRTLVTCWTVNQIVRDPRWLDAVRSSRLLAAHGRRSSRLSTTFASDGCRAGSQHGGPVLQSDSSSRVQAIATGSEIEPMDAAFVKAEAVDNHPPSPAFLVGANEGCRVEDHTASRTHELDDVIQQL